MSAATAPGVQLPAGRRGGARSSPTGTSSVLRAMASDRRPDSKFTLLWRHRLVFTHIHYNSRSFL